MELEILLKDIDERLRTAVQWFWLARDAQQKKQIDSGKKDAGTRSSVTGGGHMSAIEILVADLLRKTGLPDLTIKLGKSEDSENSKKQLELPGYYRPEKQWDMIVLSRNLLVAAIEFKSQVGPSFGNNANNRTEEAIGSAEDVWKAFREGRFGKAPAPFLGYFFLLEDCEEVHNPMSPKEPFFEVDPIFKRTPISPKKGKGVNKYREMSYAERYKTLCTRLMLERLYTASCLILATKSNPTRMTTPSNELNFRRFAAALIGHTQTFILSLPKDEQAQDKSDITTKIELEG